MGGTGGEQASSLIDGEGLEVPPLQTTPNWDFPGLDDN